MSNSITPEELAEKLLSSSEVVSMYQRGVRNQGHSKYVAISKILPRRFKFVRIYKIAEQNNAVLVLFVEPTQGGYNVII